MFTQRGKIGDGKGNGKEKEQTTRRNLDHITCNSCGEKGNYTGNSDCPNQANLKEYEEELRNMKQEKYSKNTPGGGDQKSLVNVKDASCSLMMGAPTKEWGKLPSTGLMLCQTSTQEVPQTEPIKKSLKKGNVSIIHVSYTILAAAAEAGIDENWCLLDNQ